LIQRSALWAKWEDERRGVWRLGGGETRAGRHWPRGRRRLRVLAQNLAGEMLLFEVHLGVSPSGCRPLHSTRLPKPTPALTSRRCTQRITSITPLAGSWPIRALASPSSPSLGNGRGEQSVASPRRLDVPCCRGSGVSPLGPLRNRRRTPDTFPAVAVADRHPWAISEQWLL
jgi:hypothetical protein